MPDDEKEETEKEKEAKRLAELCADDLRTRTATREDDLGHERSHR